VSFREEYGSVHSMVSRLYKQYVHVRRDSSSKDHVSTTCEVYSIGRCHDEECGCKYRALDFLHKSSRYAFHQTSILEVMP